MPARRRRYLRLILLTIGVVAGLVLTEGALRLRRVVLERWVPPMTIPDARLGHRLNPAYPGHDVRGWRNQVPLDAADIVALGDSQTYGLGVSV
jgi:hypothetical protein